MKDPELSPRIDTLITIYLDGKFIRHLSGSEILSLDSYGTASREITGPWRRGFLEPIENLIEHDEVDSYALAIILLRYVTLNPTLEPDRNTIFLKSLNEFLATHAPERSSLFMYSKSPVDLFRQILNDPKLSTSENLVESYLTFYANQITDRGSFKTYHNLVLQVYQSIIYSERTPNICLVDKAPILEQTYKSLSAAQAHFKKNSWNLEELESTQTLLDKVFILNLDHLRAPEIKEGKYQGYHMLIDPSTGVSEFKSPSGFEGVVAVAKPYFLVTQPGAERSTMGVGFTSVSGISPDEAPFYKPRFHTFFPPMSIDELVEGAQRVLESPVTAPIPQKKGAGTKLFGFFPLYSKKDDALVDGEDAAGEPGEPAMLEDVVTAQVPTCMWINTVRIKGTPFELKRIGSHYPVFMELRAPHQDRLLDNVFAIGLDSSPEPSTLVEKAAAASPAKGFLPSPSRNMLRVLDTMASPIDKKVVTKRDRTRRLREKLTRALENGQRRGVLQFYPCRDDDYVLIDFALTDMRQLGEHLHYVLERIASKGTSVTITKEMISESLSGLVGGISLPQIYAWNDLIQVYTAQLKETGALPRSPRVSSYRPTRPALPPGLSRQIFSEAAAAASAEPSPAPAERAAKRRRR